MTITGLALGAEATDRLAQSRARRWASPAFRLLGPGVVVEYRWESTWTVIWRTRMDPESKAADPMSARPSEPASSAESGRPGSDFSAAVSPPPRLAEAARSQQAEPESVLEDLRAHLAEGRFRTAQRLAKEGAARFPEHAPIRQMNRGLNEWTATTRPTDEPDRSEEFEWLRDPPEAARGKWVALVGSEMVASADTLVAVMESVESMNLSTIPLVHRID